MAKRKSRFPSYGLVRGASHAQGGVAGVVAGAQPVELEGGEWIVPKEAVPDYLPVLKQITNEGRAMQQMDNGNTAMDALIASASMQNGITQPKSPMYQDGGQVVSKRLTMTRPVAHDLQRDKDKFRAQSILSIPAEQVGGEEGLRYYLSDPQLSDDMQMARTQADFDARAKMAFAPEDSLPAALVEGYFDRQNKKSPLDFLKKLIGKEQGGPVDSYEGGGQLHSRRMYNQKDEDKYGYRAGGPINQYQQGGQMQPRRQQEIRNPEVYGPPVPADIDSLLNQLMMRDVNQSINPFSGDTLDFEEDSLRLLGRMKKSHMPTYGRKKMQQGGPVGGQLGEGQPLERRSSPSEQLAQLQGMETSPQNSLMGAAGQDGRIQAIPPDKYIIKDGTMSTREMEIPKLSPAYLQSFGLETPLSKRQNDLLRHRALSPETIGINPQVQSLFGKALIQRLANEPL